MDGHHFDDDATGTSGGAGAHLWLPEAGRLWDLGPATSDTDADGVGDSLSRTDAEGLTVFTDTDRDGRVDLITRVGADGEISSSTYDPTSGTWSAAKPGRLR